MVILLVFCMSFNPNKPFNDLPLLPPRESIETIGILRKCISARAALAELKGVCDTIPDPSILIRSIGLQEARVSSEIENILTTTDDLYQALADSVDAADPATKEVLRYQEALMAGVKAVHQNPILSTNLCSEIATKIKQREMEVRKLPGTKIMDTAKNLVVYTPPEGEALIRTKLANLEEFIHSTSELDPLIKMALIHYQFEAIHPFADGNGRTGRILNILYLVQQQLLHMPVLYLSRFLIQHKNDYYAKLRAVTEDSQWEPWIEFMLNGVEQTANNTRERIVEIKKAMQLTHEQLLEKLPRIASKDLVELLFLHPYCKIKFVEKHNRVTRQTAAAYLKALEEIGIVQGVKLGREMYYLNRSLLNILRN